MIQKIFVYALKILSGIVYTLTLLIILGTPVLFIYYAVSPPVLTVNSAEITESISGSDGEVWQRADIEMTGESGKFSPYYYEIDKFTAGGIEEETDVMLDSPVYFTSREKDDFVLTLYIKTDSPEKAEELMKTASFRPEGYKKGFASFFLYYN